MGKETTSIKAGITALGLIFALLIPAFMGMYIDYGRDKLLYDFDETPKLIGSDVELAPMNKSVLIDGFPNKGFPRNDTNAVAYWGDYFYDDFNGSFQNTAVYIGNNTYRCSPDVSDYEFDESSYLIALDMTLAELYSLDNVFISIKTTFPDNVITHSYYLTFGYAVIPPPPAFVDETMTLIRDQTYYVELRQWIRTLIESETFPADAQPWLQIYFEDYTAVENETFDIQIRIWTPTNNLVFKEAVLWTLGLSMAITGMVIIAIFGSELVDIKLDRKKRGKQ